MTEIVQGDLYRRKSDGAKLIALRPRTDEVEGWRFWDESTDCFAYGPLRSVEPWRDPIRKTVTGYVWLYQCGNSVVSVTPSGKIGAGDVIACKRFTVEIEKGCFDE